MRLGSFGDESNSWMIDQEMINFSKQIQDQDPTQFSNFSDEKGELSHEIEKLSRAGLENRVKIAFLRADIERMQAAKKAADKERKQKEQFKLMVFVEKLKMEQAQEEYHKPKHQLRGEEKHVIVKKPLLDVEEWQHAVDNAFQQASKSDH